MSKTKGLKIAIGSKSRTGKDTIADEIVRVRGGTKLAFSGPLYDITNFIQSSLNKPVHKDPDLLKFIGQGLKDIYEPDVWAASIEFKINDLLAEDDSSNIIISDLRFTEEWDIIKRYGFVTVRVNRKDRPIDRDPNHVSEVCLDNKEFDYVIENDGDLEDLKKKALFVCESIASRNL